MKKKTVTTAKTTKTEKKYKKRKIASILMWVAVILLIFNAVYAIVLKDKLVSQIDAQTMQELIELGVSASMIESTILFIAIIWMVFAVLMFLAKIGIEKKKAGWGWLLGLSIVTIFIGRLESAVLGIIASILYAKSK